MHTFADEMAAAAQQAVATARERFDVELDFTIESVKHLDRILHRQHAQIPRGLSRLLQRGPADETIRHSARIWGAYLGEVIRKQWGGEWRVAEDGPYEDSPVLVLLDRGIQTCPAAKVYKRLTNGPAESIWKYLATLNATVARQTAEPGAT